MHFLPNLLFILLTANVLSQEDNDDQTTMNLKTQQEFITLDSTMNAMISQIISENSITDSVFIRDLKISQLKWEEWKNSELNILFKETESNNYSSYFFCYYSELILLTEQRIKILQDFYLNGGTTKCK